jgi:prepilin-type N-terminal cleavage/methylation domain-containing protein
MMKKNGFTLAEVLITLAIIGVVATMTLPALMTNTGEQQAKTGLKKGINTLTEAAQMNEAIDIGDMDELKERVREMPEKTIYRVVFGEGATGNEQKDG